MGKNSLVKSTTKKKTPSKKKSTSPKRKEAPKSASAKTRPAKATAKSKTSGTKAKKSKAPSIKTLVFKKFDSWQPETRFVPKGGKSPQDYTAPPFFTGKSQTEQSRLRALLLKKFDLTETLEKPAETPPAPPGPSEASSAAATSPEPRYPSEPPKAAEAESAATPVEEKGAVTTEAPPLPKAPEPEKKTPEPAVASCRPPEPPKAADPMARAMKFGLAGFALLILVLIAVSASNSKSYAVKPADGGIEIWKGIFAPIGQKRILALPGVPVPKPLKDHYSKTEAFSLAFGYYLKKADALLNVSGMPDFEGIRQTLNTAAAYAATETQQVKVDKRLAHLDLMLLLYKADVALGQGTLEGAETAMDYLEEAGTLPLDKNQKAMVKDRLDAARKAAVELRADAQAKPAPPPAASSKNM